MRGEETIITFDEEARELLRTDLCDTRGSVGQMVFVVVQRRPVAHAGVDFNGHGRVELIGFCGCTLQAVVGYTARREEISDG